VTTTWLFRTASTGAPVPLLGVKGAPGTPSATFHASRAGSREISLIASCGA
jgi:hypothetical protein